MISRTLHNLSSYLSIGFFILVLVAAPLTLIPKTTYATGWPVFDGGNFIQNTISALEAPVQTALSNSLVVKEYKLDAIAWALVNVLLEEMIRSTTDWVASGFQGKPYFMDDFKGFLSDTADRHALAFINQDIARFLCEPFRASITLAIQLEYQASRRYMATCRLTDAIRNFESFRNGDFIAGGGWDAWFDVSLNPNMYAQGAQANATAALSAGASGRARQELAKLNWASGFRDNKKCTSVPRADGGTDEKCETLTPGQSIQGYLADTLSINNERLTIADELDELLGALVTQLASQLLGGGGLAGLGAGGGNAGGNAYINGFSTPVTQEHDQETDVNALREQSLQMNQQAQLATSTTASTTEITNSIPFGLEAEDPYVTEYLNSLGADIQTMQ